MRETWVSAARPVLAGWDLHSSVESRGSHLFREFCAGPCAGHRQRRQLERFLPALLNYTVAFDIINDPVNTHRADSIPSDNPVALQALALAGKLRAPALRWMQKLGISDGYRGEVFPGTGVRSSRASSIK